jgi:hypothetical protein
MHGRGRPPPGGASRPVAQRPHHATCNSAQHATRNEMRRAMQRRRPRAAGLCAARRRRRRRTSPPTVDRQVCASAGPQATPSSTFEYHRVLLTCAGLMYSTVLNSTWKFNGTNPRRLRSAACCPALSGPGERGSSLQQRSHAKPQMCAECGRADGSFHPAADRDVSITQHSPLSGVTGGRKSQAVRLRPLTTGGIGFSPCHRQEHTCEKGPGSTYRCSAGNMSALGGSAGDSP